MDEEPTLPPLPAVAWNQQTQSFSNSRKRGRRGNAPSLFSNSSDPAVFSSDDDPAALDNYVHGRRKKRYVGAWFSQLPTSSDSTFDDDGGEAAPPSARQKRTLERQLDSGVWLGGEDEEDMDLDGEAPPPPQRRRRQAFQRVPSLRVGAAEMNARNAIQRCIDDGLEDIDLSNWDLEDLTNATVEPLSGFSCIPLVTPEVVFEQRSPSLKLNLSRNRLTRLPGAIFDVEHLTMLSVTRNKLREIPPAIGKLRNLRELNVSMNYLRFLPYELLELLQGENNTAAIYVHPNPFYSPHKDGLEQLRQRRAERKEAEAEADGVSQNPPAVLSGRYRLVACSPVQYLDSRGETYSRFRLPSAPASRGRIVIDVDVAEDTHSPPSSDPKHSKSHPSSLLPSPSRVPTLIELALRACYNSPELESAPSMLPPRTPDYVVRHLEAALAQKETGGWTCTVCRRPMIVPRAVWLEWWELSPPVPADWSDERLVPFIRRGCSWLCVPSRGVDRAQETGEGAAGAPAAS